MAEKDKERVLGTGARGDVTKPDEKPLVDVSDLTEKEARTAIKEAVAEEKAAAKQAAAEAKEQENTDG